MASPQAPRIALGVTGSIAAYKACELVRRLREHGAEVRCVMTGSAERFVTPLSLGVLSGQKVLKDLYDASEWESAHLALADWAQLVLVAPVTADTLARLAQGRADDLLASLVLSARCPVALAPAMESAMWKHPATQANVRALKSYGYELWGPAAGTLASGKSGVGRLIEPAELAAKALAVCKRSARKK